MTADLQKAALAYVRAGWPVFPCNPSTKAPLTPHGFKDATCDEARVTTWWCGWPRALLGTALPATVFVLDVDDKHGIDGTESLHCLQAEFETLPRTLTCLTRHGQHLYFAHPGGELRQGTSILGPGLDTRIPGKGYVILPPSSHPDGGTYRWADPNTPIASPPVWLVEKLRRQKSSLDHSALAGVRWAGDRQPHRAVSKRYVERAIVDECSDLAATPEGQRNDRLYKAAFALSRFVQTGEADQRGVEQALIVAATATGLEQSEIEATIRSAFRVRGVVVR